MTSPAQYKIETVMDMLPLSPEQTDRCLADLKTWLAFRRHLEKVTAAALEMAAAMGMGPDDLEIEHLNHMLWIDDGIEGGAVTLEIKHGPEGDVLFSENFNINSDGQVVIEKGAANEQ